MEEGDLLTFAQIAINISILVDKGHAGDVACFADCYV